MEVVSWESVYVTDHHQMVPTLTFTLVPLLVSSISLLAGRIQRDENEANVL